MRADNHCSWGLAECLCCCLLGNCFYSMPNVLLFWAISSKSLIYNLNRLFRLRRNVNVTLMLIFVMLQVIREFMRQHNNLGDYRWPLRPDTSRSPDFQLFSPEMKNVITIKHWRFTSCLSILSEIASRPWRAIIGSFTWFTVFAGTGSWAR